MQGKIISIVIAKTAKTQAELVEQAELQASKGVVGDRYYTGLGTFSEKLAGKPAKELTLIESEEISSFNQQAGLSLAFTDLRRNIITEDIRLNNLIGKTFFIGTVELLGIKLCEPCTHLAQQLAPEILPGLIGRGGLRASIITGGLINTGDSIYT